MSTPLTGATGGEDAAGPRPLECGHRVQALTRSADSPALHALGAQAAVR
jgi:hypothetical protein